MRADPWLPIGYILPQGSACGRLLHQGENWQIVGLDRGGRALLARQSLVDRWAAHALLPATAFQPVDRLDEATCSLVSDAGHRLEPLDSAAPPESMADCLSLAISLRETRALDSDMPLHDGLFVERFSRLLPTWSVSERDPDDVLLGHWLTGGVRVSATAVRRVAALMGWLNSEGVEEVAIAAGLVVTTGRGDVTRGASHSSSIEPNSSGIGSLAKCPEFHLAGRDALEIFFREQVIDILEHAARYATLGIDFPGAIVLHGPPGCGKTFAVERLAEYLDWPVYRVESSTVASPYIHDTSRKVGELFDEAIEHAPSILIIDEMEAYLADRQSGGSTGLHHVEEVGEFLRRIPEAAANRVLVVGMTNRLEMIDPAILRRGRFDHVVEVGMPSAEEVAALLRQLVGKVPCEEGLSLEHAIEQLAGRPLSDVAFSVREAARLTARAGREVLSAESIEQAVAALPPVEQKKRRIGFVED